MIAQTILQQIGGRRFTAMTGSRDFIDMGNGLRMSLARNKTSANRLDIIYDAGADLYNMRFYRRTFSKKTFESRTKDIAIHEGIYFDMLEEIGLDFSKNYVDSKEKQIYAFRSVLNYIKGDNKIVSVHSRKAEKEVFELLQEYGTKNVIFHWYSGPLNLIDEIINAGYYFSINEAMTTSISGRKIISKIPLNRILTETDAPFNKHSNILNAISNIGLTEDVIYSNFLNLINAIV